MMNINVTTVFTPAQRQELKKVYGENTRRAKFLKNMDEKIRREMYTKPKFPAHPAIGMKRA